MNGMVIMISLAVAVIIELSIFAIFSPLINYEVSVFA